MLVKDLTADGAEEYVAGAHFDISPPYRLKRVCRMSDRRWLERGEFQVLNYEGCKEYYKKILEQLPGYLKTFMKYNPAETHRLHMSRAIYNELAARKGMHRSDLSEMLELMTGHRHPYWRYEVVTDLEEDTFMLKKKPEKKDANNR